MKTHAITYKVPAVRCYVALWRRNFFPRFYYYILLSDFSKRQHYLEYDISNYQSTNWLSMPLSHIIMISYNKSWWYGAKMQKRGRFLMLEEKKTYLFCFSVYMAALLLPPKNISKMFICFIVIHIWIHHTCN